MGTPGPHARLRRSAGSASEPPPPAEAIRGVDRGRKKAARAHAQLGWSEAACASRLARQAIERPPVGLDFAERLLHVSDDHALKRPPFGGGAFAVL